MNIIPVRPDIVEAHDTNREQTGSSTAGPASPLPATDSWFRSLRTFGRNLPSRRTMGRRSPSRRTMGKNIPSRRTMGAHIPSRRTMGKSHP